MPHPTQMSVKQLAKLLGTTNCPVILDVSIDDDFNEDPYLIPTAKRVPHTQIDQFKPDRDTDRILVVCQKGKKLSEGAAACLRANGYHAENLEGGNYGWRDAGQMRVPADAIPNLAQGGTVWVTRHRPKIDRIACPWLIRRFVDPRAKFLFVAPSEVGAVAEKFNAIPFDVEGVDWSHHDDKCSFDQFIDKLGLNSEPLARIAKIIRGADTNRHDLAPQAAGLMAISLGLSRMYSDDLEQLTAGLTLYDALYRWARDATRETHDWETLAKGTPKNA